MVVGQYFRNIIKRLKQIKKMIAIIISNLIVILISTIYIVGKLNRLNKKESNLKNKIVELEIKNMKLGNEVSKSHHNSRINTLIKHYSNN